MCVLKLFMLFKQWKEENDVEKFQININFWRNNDKRASHTHSHMPVVIGN